MPHDYYYIDLILAPTSQTKLVALEKEIRSWIKENDMKCKFLISNSGVASVMFINEEDKLAFLLRWIYE